MNRNLQFMIDNLQTKGDGGWKLTMKSKSQIPCRRNEMLNRLRKFLMSNVLNASDLCNPISSPNRGPSIHSAYRFQPRHLLQNQTMSEITDSPSPRFDAALGNLRSQGGVLCWGWKSSVGIARRERSRKITVGLCWVFLWRSTSLHCSRHNNNEAVKLGLDVVI
ncbi:uncharacterized protein N7529_003307 [Penicillium soppii]|uniref:uncharacterized protein n=1 Tax=Penicillium soppii TaxID=69789 RepID=UPI002548AC93|nr:uncharacterized protein N7529_003307 [Penicillium soppii]KAJ5874877.1 hypothetical protein N7529_003307 [Penicillium soppii]